MTGRIVVYIDHFQGTPLQGSWEAIGAARALQQDLGGEIEAIVLGQEVKSLATQALGFGASSASHASHPDLKDFRVEVYASILKDMLNDAAVVLFPDSGRTRDLAGMLSADLDTGVIADVTALQVRDGKLTATRPIYAGKLLCEVVQVGDGPALVTLRSRTFAMPEPASSAGAPSALEVGEIKALSQVMEYKVSEAGVSLTDAAVIVSGGRGVSNNPSLQPPAEVSGEKEIEIWRAHQGFALVSALAKVLGGAVGASRAAVDAGYIPYSHQVGQTGKVVSPDLYIACGISGAIQHLAGMRTAKTIVAINTDKDAPIFKLARFGVVGDLYQVVPALTESLRQKLGK